MLKLKIIKFYATSTLVIMKINQLFVQFLIFLIFFRDNQIRKIYTSSLIKLKVINLESIITTQINKIL